MSLDSNSASNLICKQVKVQNVMWDLTDNISTNEITDIPSSTYQILPQEQFSNISTNEFKIDPQFLRKPVEIKKVVYTEFSNEQEHLIYKSKKMKVGKIYPVIWKGEKLALRKTKDGSIQILKQI